MGLRVDRQTAALSAIVLAAGAADAAFLEMLLARSSGGAFSARQLSGSLPMAFVVHGAAWVVLSRVLAHYGRMPLHAALRLDAFTHLPSLLLLLCVFRPDIQPWSLAIPVALAWPLKYAAYRYVIGRSSLVTLLAEQRMAKGIAWGTLALVLYVSSTAWGLNLGTIPENLLYVATHAGASYEEKMEAKGWRDIPAYGEFVRAHSPEDAVVLLPPGTREKHWGHAEEREYMLYFLYPRGAVRAVTLVPTVEDLARVTHVVVAPARREDANQDEPSVWPSWPVPPLPYGRLYPMPDGVWGLIELASGGE